MIRHYALEIEGSVIDVQMLNGEPPNERDIAFFTAVVKALKVARSSRPVDPLGCQRVDRLPDRAS